MSEAGAARRKDGGGSCDSEGGRGWVVGEGGMGDGVEWSWRRAS